MVSTFALSGSPVTFVDPTEGKQYQIPVSLLSFDETGQLNVALPAGSPILAFGSLVANMLATLVAEGLIVPAPAPSSVPALTITARDPGSEGNSIVLSFTNPAPNKATPAAGTIDVTLTVTQVHSGLTLASVVSAFGSSAATASGLLFVSDTPASTTDLPGVGSVAAAGTSPALTWPVLSGAASPTVLFTLAPRHGTSGTDAPADVSAIKVAVTAVDTAADSFSLSVSWTKTQAAVALSALLAPATNPFAYAVAFSQVSAGSTTLPAALPSAGTVTLHGGSDATSGSASASAFATLST